MSEIAFETPLDDLMVEVIGQMKAGCLVELTARDGMSSTNCGTAVIAEMVRRLEAADTIAAQAAEIERLRAALSMTNEGVPADEAMRIQGCAALGGSDG